MIPESRLAVSPSRSDQKTITYVKKEKQLRETLTKDYTELKEMVENTQREKVETLGRSRAWTWEGKDAINVVISPPREEQIDKSPKLPRVRKHGVADIQGERTIQRRSFDSLVPNQTVKESSRSFEDLRKISTAVLAGYKFIKEPKQRVSVYEEEPFYLCPENGSFRRASWQSGIQSRRASSRPDKDQTEDVREHEEAPLAEILPPIILPSVYEQERRKQGIKRPGKKQQKKEKSEKKTVHGGNLTRRLKDCRYLRIPQSRFTSGLQN